MTPTVPVTVTLVSQDGVPYAGVIVRARLDVNEVYEGFVISDEAKAPSDADGVAILNCFPNAPAPAGLGTQGSTYTFRATIPGGRSLNVEARVPNTACRLENILVSDTAVSLDAAQAALIQAQAAVTTAATSASDAEASAAAAATSEADAAASATAAAGSASAAAASQANAASSASAAAGSAAQVAHVYPGSYPADPTTRPDGSARQAGDYYFNSSTNLNYRFNGSTWVASDINTADLAATGGSALVGSDDGASGSLWTTVAGFIAKIISSAGGSVVGFIHSLTGAIRRTITSRLLDYVHVTDFMSTSQIDDVRNGVGAVEVRDAWQAAVDSGATTIIAPPGIHLLTATSTVVFTYGNTALNVYRAVNINRSNLRIVGPGAIIKVKPYTGDTGGLHYAFATAKNMNVGDLSNIRFDGIKFEFDVTGEGASYTKRPIYFGGVQGIFLDDIEVGTSSASRAGGAISVQQSRTVRVTNYRLKHCTQGFNFSFVDDVVFDNHQYDNFNEAIDFDRKVSNFHLSNLTFLGSSSAQAIDLNSCTDGVVENVYASNVPNLCIVNYKETTPPTYAQYLSNTDAQNITYNQTNSSFSPSKRVTLRGFRGDTVGSSTQPCISIGIDRTANFTNGGPCEDLTLEDVKFTNCGPLNIEDVKNFVLRDVVLDTVAVPTDASYGAITASADRTYTEAELSGMMQNVRIVNSSGKGMRVTAPTRLLLDKVEVDGFNTANTAGNGKAFHITGLDARRGQIYIDRTLARGGTNSPVAWTFSEDTGVAAYECQIYWGEGNRIDIATVPTAISFGQANTQKRVKKKVQVPVGTITLSSGTKDYLALAPQKNKGMYLCWASAIATQALAANGTNYLSHNTRSLVSGSDAAVASGTFTAGMTAGADTDLGVAYNETAAQLAYGDIAYFRLGVVGTGGTINGLSLQAHYIDYATN